MDHKNSGPSQAVLDGKAFSFGGLEISVRLLTVALLAGVLAVFLLPNVYDWWRQEQDYRDIQARVAAAQERNAAMEEQLELWQDPEYIASQARDRLGYVKKGETQYAVVDPGDDYQDDAQVSAALDEGPKRPWVQVVGILIQKADEADPVDGDAAHNSSQSGAGVQSGTAQSGAGVQSGASTTDQESGR
ncbi:FtsB family cell division protein [Schaalia vaccimaxillae]|uniref:FtsB family cell division protein n=1 Tax=Schaalia vaccimaxillae TaxID=183916 RepID=UPI00041C37BB|nr:septum formation initiator family protein [Schaalia vaccimaxillae]